MCKRVIGSRTSDKVVEARIGAFGRSKTSQNVPHLVTHNLAVNVSLVLNNNRDVKTSKFNVRVFKVQFKST